MFILIYQVVNYIVSIVYYYEFLWVNYLLKSLEYFASHKDNFESYLFLLVSKI